MQDDDVVIDPEREAASERETEYLLSSPTNRKRLLDALGRTETISLEAVIEKLGV
jgi:PHD/YefM family antitoxin component YafN of YafNO toxin-antitoxin module